MANMVSWDPFSEFTPLRQMMDRLMEDAWVRPRGSWGQGGQDDFGRFAFDMYETGDDYVITATLPGLRPEDLELQVQGNTLTITGETKADEKEGEQRTYHTRERRFGRFSRQVTLPSGINADKVQASLEHGVLTLHIPKAEEMKPRRIQVTAGSGTQTPQLIEGERKAA
jgi:HSP20 family protein